MKILIQEISLDEIANVLIEIAKVNSWLFTNLTNGTNENELRRKIIEKLSDKQ